MSRLTKTEHTFRIRGRFYNPGCWIHKYTYRHFVKCKNQRKSKHKRTIISGEYFKHVKGLNDGE